MLDHKQQVDLKIGIFLYVVILPKGNEPTKG
ncbi:hypothetical protein B14911_04499 [Bacillus sp. NRRL B-14911]|nr:hypothetical protein B14911_04499 [Bacillus sp. NRRL B-14911]